MTAKNPVGKPGIIRKAQERRKDEETIKQTLSRALELLCRLYADKTHFIYELLQNAEDAGAEKIRFSVYDDRLEVFHDGRPFTDSNLCGLLDAGLSDKANNGTAIGEFGIGFKSVFSICSEVRLYSRPQNYRGPGDVRGAEPFAINITDFIFPDEIDFPDDCMSADYTTKFVFPYSVGETYNGYSSVGELTADLADKLEKLGSVTLLFLKRLKSIEYEINTSGYRTSGSFSLDRNEINIDRPGIGCVRVDDRYGGEGEDGADAGKDSPAGNSYLVFSKKYEDARIKVERSVDIAFAFKEEDGEWRFVPTSGSYPYISVFFPTASESKLNFIVQGPYRTTPNRGSLVEDDQDNKDIASRTAELFRESVLAIKDMGKLNLSFVSKVLPLNYGDFYFTYTSGRYVSQPIARHFFSCIYDECVSLLRGERILPSKNGGFTRSWDALLARGRELTDVFSDEDISFLLHKGEEKHWLSDDITPDREPRLYEFLQSRLNVEVVRPEDLYRSFNRNEKFLKGKSDDFEWLAKFYNYLSSVPNLFNMAGKNGGQMLTVPFVKTQSGKILAPFVKDGGGRYSPILFLPFEGGEISGVETVDPELYRECRVFFDRTLGLKRPDEYSLWKEDYAKRQGAGDDEQNIRDVGFMLKYMDDSDRADETYDMAEQYLRIRCVRGGNETWCNPLKETVYSKTDGYGLGIADYFFPEQMTYVDSDFYAGHGIDFKKMVGLMKIKDVLYEGENEREWRKYDKDAHDVCDYVAYGSFRPAFTLTRIEAALNHIRDYPDDENSRSKSAIIFRYLLENTDKLKGDISIGEKFKADRPGRLLQTLCDSVAWLYDDSNNLVAPKDISKYRLNERLYGRVDRESALYGMLGFSTDSDEDRDEKLKLMDLSDTDIQFIFRRELAKYGLRPEDLEHGISTDGKGPGVTPPPVPEYEFPTHEVVNWDSLRRAAVEKWLYAAPVKYEERLRSVRVSGDAARAASYVKHMYRVGRNVYACQICHGFSEDVEACQIDERGKAVKELEAMHLCLCPACARRFKHMWADTDGYEEFREGLADMSRAKIEAADLVRISLGAEEVWFTQRHIAEINELLRLQSEVGIDDDAGQT